MFYAAKEKHLKTEEFISSSAAETEKIGLDFARKLKGCETIAFFGDLGAGKTTFTRGLAKGLGVDEKEISSPTFAIVHEHNGKCMLYHFDMYRVSSWEDLDTTGFFDVLEKGVVVVEWSENIKNALPDDRIEIRLSQEENESRKIHIDYFGGCAL